jgi:Flp pilus assembly pilin Flp
VFVVEERKEEVMKNLIQRFIREEDGQDLVEYAFLIVFIAILAITILKGTSTAINGVFQKIINALA